MSAEPSSIFGRGGRWRNGCRRAKVMNSKRAAGGASAVGGTDASGPPPRAGVGVALEPQRAQQGRAEEPRTKAGATAAGERPAAGATQRSRTTMSGPPIVSATPVDSALRNYAAESQSYGPSLCVDDPGTCDGQSFSCRCLRDLCALLGPVVSPGFSYKGLCTTASYPVVTCSVPPM